MTQSMFGAIAVNSRLTRSGCFGRSRRHVLRCCPCCAEEHLRGQRGTSICPSDPGRYLGLRSSRLSRVPWFHRPRSYGHGGSAVPGSVQHPWRSGPRGQGSSLRSRCSEPPTTLCRWAVENGRRNRTCEDSGGPRSPGAGPRGGPGEFCQTVKEGAGHRSDPLLSTISADYSSTRPWSPMFGVSEESEAFAILTSAAALPGPSQYWAVSGVTSISTALGSSGPPSK